MKLTKKQKEELEVIKEHIPNNCDWPEIKDSDIKMFFEWSERGLHKEVPIEPPWIPKDDGGFTRDWTGFQALVWGKKYREITSSIEKQFNQVEVRDYEIHSK